MMAMKKLPSPVRKKEKGTTSYDNEADNSATCTRNETGSLHAETVTEHELFKIFS